MEKYIVEVMAGEVAISFDSLDSPTAELAAIESAGRLVKPWNGETNWVRVTEKDGMTIYKFAFR
jgi:hypothetical protein